MTHPHYRRCWECQAIGLHADNVAPEVCCKRCGSQDTRRQPLRVLVTGGREYADKNRMWDEMIKISHTNGILVVIHGAARGADSLASAWAKTCGIEEISCPANWKLHGRSSGPIRNREMLQHKPDLCIAFPGGAGTANMIEQAKQAGVLVRVVE